MKKLISLLLCIAGTAYAQLADGIKIYKDGDSNIIVGTHNLTSIMSNSASQWAQYPAITNLDMNTNNMVNVGSLTFGMPVPDPVFTNKVIGSDSTAGIGTNVLGPVNTYYPTTNGTEWYVDATYGVDASWQGHSPTSGAFKTIQYAITNAGIGDTLHLEGTFILGSVTPGEFSPNLGPIIANRNQTLLGHGTAVIDGGADSVYIGETLVMNTNATRCIELTAGIIDGVTFTRGHGRRGTKPVGYGMHIYMETGTVQNCTIQNMNNYVLTGSEIRGAVYMEHGNVRGCTIHDNTIDMAFDAYGIGINAQGDSAVLDCNIHSNQVFTSGVYPVAYGGGIHMNGGNVKVKNCDIFNNGAYVDEYSVNNGACRGGGVCVTGTMSSVSGMFGYNKINNNYNWSYGGAGMYINFDYTDIVGDGHYMTMDYCEFNGNGDPSEVLPAGSAIYVESYSHLVLNHCGVGVGEGNYGCEVGTIYLATLTGETYMYNVVTNTINNSKLQNNSTTISGAGIAIPNITCSPLLTTNCYFANNSNTNEISKGSAILVEGDNLVAGDLRPTLNVQYCTFNTNSAGNKGGAVAVDYNGAYTRLATVINGSVFEGNNTTNYIDASTMGGAVYAGVNMANITRCKFKNNQAYAYGGAVAFSAQADISLTNTVNNCLFDGNTLAGAGALGNAVYLPNQSIVCNCTLVNNLSDTNITASEAQATVRGIPVLAGLPSVDICRPIVINNIFVNSNYSALAGDTSDIKYNRVDSGPYGNNNVTYDPMFITASNNTYYLYTYSPLINMGMTTTFAGSEDLVGDPRVKDNNIDMGCYEVAKGSPGILVDADSIMRISAAQVIIDLLDVEELKLGGAALYTGTVVDSGGNTLHYDNGVLVDVTPP